MKQPFDDYVWVPGRPGLGPPPPEKIEFELTGVVTDVQPKSPYYDEGWAVVTIDGYTRYVQLPAEQFQKLEAAYKANPNPKFRLTINVKIEEEE